MTTNMPKIEMSVSTFVCNLQIPDARVHANETMSRIQILGVPSLTIITLLIIINLKLLHLILLRKLDLLLVGAGRSHLVFLRGWHDELNK